MAAFIKGAIWAVRETFHWNVTQTVSTTTTADVHNYGVGAYGVGVYW